MQLSLLDRVSPAAPSKRAWHSAESEPASELASELAELSWARASRVDLGAGAWLEVVRRWVPRHAWLFDLLRSTADWELHERQMYERVIAVPRLVASCPGAGASGPWTSETAVRVLPHPASAEDVRQGAGGLRALGASLSSRYGRHLPSISLAYYRDGKDSVAFHGDRLGPLRQDTVVAILSLGAPRRFLLRRAANYSGPLPQALLSAGIGVARGRATYALSVGEGDLLVMGGTCQETWEHGVPKQPGARPRIAVMFRERWDDGEGAVRNVRGVRTPRGKFL